MLRRTSMLVLLVACGDDPYTGLLKPPSSNEGMQLTVSAHVEPGQELVACRNFAVPEGTFDIGRFEHAMTDVSHHLLVYQLDIPASEVTNEVFLGCDESADNQKHRVGFLYGAQGSASDLVLPDGIAFPARGGLSLQMEYHVFNTSDDAVDAEAAFNLWRAKGDIVGEAGMLFLYHTQIAVAPMSRATAHARRSYPSDFNLMMLVPHMHSRGVAMQASRIVGGSRSEQLFSVTGWENDTIYYDPPIPFAAGDELDYQCDYDNTTSEYFFDGFSARHDEMCVTGGVYYRNGDRMPLTEEVSFGRGIIYSGTKSCAQVQACDLAIDYSNTTIKPTAYQQFDLCVVQGCQDGAQAYQGLDNCRYTSCKDSCFTTASDGTVIGLKVTDSACTSCVDAMCAPQRDACSAATCM